MLAFALLGGTVYLFFTMPTGFIPSQDSGFIYGVTLAGQDISFESMAKHQRAVADLIGKDPNVEGMFANASDSNSGIVFAMLKPRVERALSVDQVIAELRPKLAARARHAGVPAESAAHHHQRPEHHQRLPDDAAERQSAGDLHLGAAACWTRCGACPGFVDVNSDLQIRSPQVKVDIDRDRALSLGVTPAAD